MEKEAYKKEYDRVKERVDEYFAMMVKDFTGEGYEVDLAMMDSHLVEFSRDQHDVPMKIVYSESGELLWKNRITYSKLGELSNDSRTVYGALYLTEFVVVIQVEKTLIREYSDEVLFDFLVKGLLNWIANAFREAAKGVITKQCMAFFQAVCRGSHGSDENTALYVSKLSATLYEGAKAKGRLVFCGEEECREREWAVRFREGVFLSHRSEARKMLEMSNADYLLVTDGRKIYGLVGEEEVGDAYVVNIRGIYKWQLFKFHSDGLRRFLMDVNEEVVSIHRTDVDYLRFREIYTSIFPEVVNTERHWRTIEYARRQKHGTTLLFLEDVEREAGRLSSAGVLIEKTEDVKIVEAVTAIDGAVLLDAEGYIHSIGTILDGMIMEKSKRDASRGARYNSSVNYTASYKKRAMAIVMSEDGYFNIIVDGRNLV